MLVAAIAGVMALAVNFSHYYVPHVAEWTTTQVARHSQDGVLRMAMMGDEERAFYTCARQVVRRLGESSIATFNARTEATTLVLGENRYLVRSQFNESDIRGKTERRVFNCTIRLEGDWWVIEQLDMWTVGSPSPEAQAVPAITKS